MKKKCNSILFPNDKRLSCEFSRLTFLLLVFPLLVCFYIFHCEMLHFSTRQKIRSLPCQHLSLFFFLRRQEERRTQVKLYCIISIGNIIKMIYEIPLEESLKRQSNCPIYPLSKCILRTPNCMHFQFRLVKVRS